jgi:CBS domain containing-hemolysin-like protein
MINKVNDKLTTVTLSLFATVMVLTIVTLFIPITVYALGLSLYLLLIVGAVNFILSFYLLTKYISDIIQEITNAKHYEKARCEPDTTKGNEESNEGDNPNAQANGDNRQEETKEQDGLQKAKYNRAGRLTDGVTTTRSKF